MTISTLNKCYQFPGVRFEFDAKQLVWENGVVTSLTRQEAHLLDILCYNGGEVISYNTLTNTLLAIHIEGKIVPISALIARINAKLAQFSTVQIDHINEFGYRIGPSQRNTSPSIENPQIPVTAPLDHHLPSPPTKSATPSINKRQITASLVAIIILLLI